MSHSKEDYNQFIVSKKDIHDVYTKSASLLTLVQNIIGCSTISIDSCSNCIGYSVCQTFHHPVVDSISKLFNTPFSYEEYLHSNHWKNTRKEALKRASYKCQRCSNNKKLHVHHYNYDNLWHETNKDLIVLCEACHAKAHNLDEKL